MRRRITKEEAGIPFGCAVEVEEVQGNDDSSIAERCRIFKCTRVIESSSLMQISFFTVKKQILRTTLRTAKGLWVAPQNNGQKVMVVLRI